MNILVTGGAGFIGSHVARHLTKHYPDYNVTVMDKMDYCADMKNLEDVLPLRNFNFVKGDITNIDFVNHVVKTNSIKFIMHFAAQTHVDNSFGNSFSFTHNNIYGTHVLLESARINGIRRFIHVSTDEVYGETPSGREDAFTEESLLKPTNPYSATKAAAEMLVTAYAQSYNLPVVITRGNNVYGPGQYPEKVIPLFITRAIGGERLPVHGKGDSLRSYIYIDDVVEAFDIILHMGKTGEIYNIGTRKEHSVLDIARKICDYFGMPIESSVEFVEDRPFNDRRYFIEDGKLKDLGWVPRVELAEGMDRTIRWFK